VLLPRVYPHETAGGAELLGHLWHSPRSAINLDNP
jgi:hypothetical protein